MAAVASIAAICKGADAHLQSTISGSSKFCSEYTALKGRLAEIGREAVVLAEKIKNTPIGQQLS